MVARSFCRLAVTLALTSLILVSTAYADPCTSDVLTVAHGNAGSYVWGQGDGCIMRPIQDVWAALKTPEAMSFDGSTLVSSALSPNPPAGVLFTYVNQYKAGGIFSVNWTMHWHHMLKSGTVAQPGLIQVQYLKVAGTSFISYWEGDIYLQSEGPDATSIRIRNQINAAQTSENDAASTVQQIYDKLK